MSRCFGISSVIAVDVSGEWTMKGSNYGDKLSGFSIILNKIMGSKVQWKIPSMADISSQLAYVSAVKQMETAKAYFTDLYIG